jgi:hypothetical protein
MVYESISSVTQSFRKYPFDALYESDIHGILYCELFNLFASNRINMSNRLIQRYRPSIDCINLNPVRSEYPTGVRFDVGVVDTVATDPSTLWDQEVSIAIEIKLWQIDGTGGDFRGDLLKLQKYRDKTRGSKSFCGLSLLFVHPGYDWTRYITDFSLQYPCRYLQPGIWVHVIELSKQDSWKCAEFRSAMQ